MDGRKVLKKMSCVVVPVVSFSTPSRGDAVNKFNNLQWFSRYYYCSRFPLFLLLLLPPACCSLLSGLLGHIAILYLAGSSGRIPPCSVGPLASCTLNVPSTCLVLACGIYLCVVWEFNVAIDVNGGDFTMFLF